MSKYTQTKIDRTFETAPIFDKEGQPIGRETHRIASLAPEPRQERPCEGCGKPMVVAQGQIARYHKECRKLKNR